MREGLLPHYHPVRRWSMLVALAAIGLALTFLLLAAAASLVEGLVLSPETLLTAPFRWVALPAGSV